MSKQQLYSFFIDFFEARGVTLPSCIEEFEFVSSGVLDSFELLSLIMQIELEFSVSISPEELLDEKNKTLGGLINTIEEKL
ncbi:phosphopantetheine-binding protein [Nitrincola sp. MINF-07-Sa-05]|uniref:phosphopantetheine-binding protein n=1 Tax=Nitrincola salilacus TaxID=3400273 RepID=UPI0039185A24